MIETGLSPKQEQARRAVKNFRAMLPQLSGYARAITGDKKVRVQMVRAGGSSAFTDGSTIFMMPPMALGLTLKHDSSNCDKRDKDTKQQICSACKRREGVMIVLYHELSHICFDSFSPAPLDMSEKVRTMVEELRGFGAASRAVTRYWSLRREERESYQAVAAVTDGYLAPLVNALEDVRVNTAMARVRPGTSAMHKAQAYSVLKEGNEMLTGKVVFWRDRPLNLQITIAAYLVASGYEIDGLLAEKIVEDIADERVSQILEGIADLSSNKEVFDASFKLLLELRRLGYCIPEEERQDEGEDESEQTEGPFDEEGDSDGEAPGGGGSGSGDECDSSEGRGDLGPGRDEQPSERNDDPDAEDGIDEASEEDSGNSRASRGEDSDADGEGDETPESGRSSLTPGEPEDVASEVARVLGHGDNAHGIERDEDETDRQEILVAINQGEHFDSPSATISGVLELEYDKTDIASANGAWHTTHKPTREAYGIDGDFDVPESILSPGLMRMRVAFADNQRRHHTRNLKSGKINARALGKRAALGDERLFKKSNLPGKKDYYVALSLDISGSTAGPKLLMIKRAAMAQAELLARMGIRFSIHAHSGGFPTHTSSAYVHVYHVKKADEPWSEKTKHRLRELGPDGANLDGHSLEFLRKTLDAQRATSKIGLYYSDGSMPAENYYEELDILRREIKMFERSGYTLLAVGVETSDPQQYGLDTAEVWRDEDIVKVVRHIEKGLLRDR